ncbi:MAG: hypothetical protein DRQ39_05625 [Gammaproteobacteria bacterium]|nr:MAG: hypothetical protein DRQ39_05625 [Gammaproteobacteria bacterium]RKZ92224.1 MAG: hypothetical protein DRQ40_08980 [Gammaproteobacteria bacterium]
MKEYYNNNWILKDCIYFLKLILMKLSCLTTQKSFGKLSQKRFKLNVNGPNTVQLDILAPSLAMNKNSL